MGGSFSMHTTALLGKQMIQSIQNIHECGILHRDIKPGNFCMAGAHGEKDQYGRSLCYLIDFGLSRRYVNSHGQVRQV